MFDLCEDDDNIYIALELLKDGNLLEVMKRMKENDQKFTEQEIATIVYQIVCGINYIHATNMIHRDMKLENIMVEL